jgi:hypothetical protein
MTFWRFFNMLSVIACYFSNSERFLLIWSGLFAFSTVLQVEKWNEQKTAGTFPGPS